ncbi:hypothetical protein AMC82_PD00740 (plasmid) [Rhizobium phaseoli]|nr:hypothetical protein AMC84_PD00741 [Rhizobium phaseoli]ANL76141.1 hypothetical protein AMC83_PE00730 [Rhizobium phaseoli]ANL82497.1 hypothetical protein AMC82_PD00740 [Rhizobium phaseoli]ANM08235.1 hypothetical protein AMC78_PD00727 [Rhizobium phaseoli]
MTFKTSPVSSGSSDEVGSPVCWTHGAAELLELVVFPVEIEGLRRGPCKAQDADIFLLPLVALSQRADDVVVVEGNGIFNRLADLYKRGKVQDGSRFMLFQNRVETNPVPDISLFRGSPFNELAMTV